MDKFALISVSNKDGILELAKFLVKKNYKIVSTGGTYQLFEKNNIPALKVADITSFPEILDGRVKTLHPSIHGGILANLNIQEHKETLKKHQINPISLVIVNLYPFIEKLKQNKTEAEMIENIDIGGPSMIRSAAKNHQHVSVVIDPNDYLLVQKELNENELISIKTNKYLATKAFAYTSFYDGMISQYLMKINKIDNLNNFTIPIALVNQLRYGENPHQNAAIYKTFPENDFSLLEAKQIHGKSLSYNNINDGNAAINIVKEFSYKNCFVALKHTNPCGVGLSNDSYQAWKKCYEGDKISIFGGIIATNCEVNEIIAKELNNIFLEIIIAPKFSDQALKILKTKKNLRLLILNFSKKISNFQVYKTINGGILSQENDPLIDKTTIKNWISVGSASGEKYLEDLLFAWKICKHLKSNAICVCQNEQLMGIGVGQTNRILAVKLALQSNQEKLHNAVLASDAFFPMIDSIQEIAKYPIKAIVQPGGSIKDKEIIEQANISKLAMFFTGKRHFLH